MTTTPLPAPEQLVPGFAALPAPIRAALHALRAPFPVETVKVRPGPVRRDGSAALALPYGDWWTTYLPRLNAVLDPASWRITLRPWGEQQILARLWAFDGRIVRETSGAAKGEVNGAQEAEVQAKKRLCAEGLLLGLYFYALPPIWGKGERVGREFVFAAGEEQRCVHALYARAGLLPRRFPAADIPTPPAADIPTPPTRPAPADAAPTATRRAAPTRPARG